MPGRFMFATQSYAGSNEVPLVAFVRLTLGPAVCVASLKLSMWAHGEPYRWLYGVLALVSFLVAARVFGEMPLTSGGSLLPRRGTVFDWIKVCAVLLFVGFATKYSGLYSRKVLLTWFVVTPFLLQAAQMVARRLLQSAVAEGESARSKVIVGVDEVGRALARRIREDPCQGVVRGFFDDRRQRLSGVRPEEVLGGMRDVAAYMKRNAVNVVYIALPMSRDPRLIRLLDDLRDTTASIYFVPRAGLDLKQARMDRIGDVPVIALREPPFFGVRGSMKRAIDIVVASLALALLSPLLLVIAAAVKWTSPGPVLCTQRRCGLDGKEVAIRRFRTTTVCDDATGSKALVTPLGALLRRTSLDGLPQFVNVLEGTLSLVGPRSHSPAHNEQYLRIVNTGMLRYTVRPGMTGWSQIHGLGGEGETAPRMEVRIRYELDYLKHWSLSLDLWIMLRAICTMFSRRRAY
jgi:putative colanic acid biosynthesis UDP-glucose lipid carrier transferase